MTEAPPSPTIGRVVIATPAPNDVLFGRGKAANNHEGNWRFRELVMERKDEYTGCTRQWKSEVVNDIYEKIHSMGGRFLKHVEDENVREGGKPGFFEAHKEDALEKIRQALREIRPYRDASSGGQRQHTSEALPVSSWHNLVPPANSMAVLPGGILSSHLAASLARNAPVALFQDSPWTFLQRQYITDQVALNTSMGSGSFSLNGGGGARPVPTDTERQARPQNGHQSTNSSGSTPTSQHSLADTTISTVDSASPAQDDADKQASRNGHVPQGPFASEEDALSDPDVSNFLIQSILGDPNRPRLTEEQVRLELASLTPEERESALCDKFGRSCTIHQSKRAKRELDELSIRLLVKQMRHVLERIPNERKQALVEAQGKCSAEEFSDYRLLQFLRCEGMDPKLGAERFVLYWECRRKVFGPEKYTQRMTLSEALRDDLVALETGFCYLLPSLDISGRQLLFRDPSRHTREGYTSESLVRAYWYVVEVCSRENTGIDSDVVTVAWLRNTTIWDYDRKVWDQIILFERICWPVKTPALHVCCPSFYILRIVAPILQVVAGREKRSRVVLHDVPENEILDALDEYGILKRMLPTTMGGSLEYSPSEWIANRRAAEMEEL